MSYGYLYIKRKLGVWIFSLNNEFMTFCYLLSINLVQNLGQKCHFLVKKTPNPEFFKPEKPIYRTKLYCQYYMRWKEEIWKIKSKESYWYAILLITELSYFQIRCQFCRTSEQMFWWLSPLVCCIWKICRKSTNQFKFAMALLLDVISWQSHAKTCHF